MPIEHKIGDRALDAKTPLAELIDYCNRYVFRGIREQRDSMNRGLRVPPTLSIDLGAVAIDWTRSRNYYLELDNTVTDVAFTNPADSGDYTLLVKQVGGGNAITGWPSSILWVGSAAPTITVTNGHHDLLRFFYNGSVYVGDARQNAS